MCCISKAVFAFLGLLFPLSVNFTYLPILTSLSLLVAFFPAPNSRRHPLLIHRPYLPENQVGCLQTTLLLFPQFQSPKYHYQLYSRIQWQNSMSSLTIFHRSNRSSTTNLPPHTCCLISSPNTCSNPLLILCKKCSKERPIPLPLFLRSCSLICIQRFVVRNLIGLYYSLIPFPEDHTDFPSNLLSL